MEAKVIIATGNKEKFLEFKRIFEEIGVEAIFPKDINISIDTAETGKTFLENAKIKAEAFTKETGFSCVADDSGLCIDALGGEPGVYSARYLGKDTPYVEKNKIILERLLDIPIEERTAHFESAIYFSANNLEEPIYAIGTCKGYIGFEPRGENGFGYDPIFYVGEKSYAELSPKEKDSISHRGRALSCLKQKLSKIYTECDL